MRKSSPGKSEAGTQHEAGQDSASASPGRGICAALRPVPVSDRLIVRIALSGQELRPRASVCSSLPGSSSGVSVPARNAASSNASACASASSLTTAAGLPPLRAPAVLRNSNCRRQWCSLIFESAQTSSVPTSVRCARKLHRHQSLAGLAETNHGVQRRVQMQIGGLRTFRAIGPPDRPRA